MVLFRSPLNVTFIISSISSGGAEKVMSLMGNYWSQKKSVTIITYTQKDIDFYKLDSRINRINIPLREPHKSLFFRIVNNFLRCRDIRKAIIASDPDVVISFMDTVNVLTLLATAFTRIPVIISERINPYFHNTKMFWRCLRRMTYPFASALVIQTKDLRTWGIEVSVSRRVEVIPNPILLRGKQSRIDGNPYIVSVGRLVHQKGIDVLLKSFASVEKDFPEWKLVIIGDGDKKNELIKLCIDLGIQQKVSFVGQVDSPLSLVGSAEIFVLASRFEGFPNVLLESMSAGVATISSDCPSGPRDIINNGVNGLLFENENVKMLESHLRFLIQNPISRGKIADAGLRSVMDYEIGLIMLKWESLINKVISRQYVEKN